MDEYLFVVCQRVEVQTRLNCVTRNINTFLVQLRFEYNKNAKTITGLVPGFYISICLLFLEIPAQLFPQMDFSDPKSPIKDRSSQHRKDHSPIGQVLRFYRPRRLRPSSPQKWIVYSILFFFRLIFRLNSNQILGKPIRQFSNFYRHFWPMDEWEIKEQSAELRLHLGNSIWY